MASSFVGCWRCVVHAELMQAIATIFFDLRLYVRRRGVGRRTIAGLRRPAGIIDSRSPRVATKDHPGRFAKCEIAYVWVRGGPISKGDGVTHRTVLVAAVFSA